MAKAISPSFSSTAALRLIERSDPETLPSNLLIFATIFRFYFLRLAVFFGCVGIFTNLFRGEMLDKSLHFYLLTPVRREILLAGKYLAGLLRHGGHLHRQRRAAMGCDALAVQPRRRGRLISPDRRRRISCRIWA